MTQDNHQEGETRSGPTWCSKFVVSIENPVFIYVSMTAGEVLRRQEQWRQIEKFPDLHNK